jgi:hypothetical protein
MKTKRKIYLPDKIYNYSGLDTISYKLLFMQTAKKSKMKKIVKLRIVTALIEEKYTHCETYIYY